MTDLFPSPTADRRPLTAAKRSALHQWFTPCWAAEELVSTFLPFLDNYDTVIEPSCGSGSFLKAIPESVGAVGVEVDPIVAAQARQNTGRPVIDGDFCDETLELPAPTAIIGNPPFNMRLVDRFLARAHGLLPEGGRCAFILPAWSLQTSSRLLKWNQAWSVSQTLLPRNLFPRSRLPLLFVIFDKDRRGCRKLIGFTMYHEAAEIMGLPGWAKSVLHHGEPNTARPARSTWRAVVDIALRKIGGRGTLQEIYHVMRERTARATDNKWWKDKVRQVLQENFVRFGPATYGLAPETIAA